LDFFVSALPSLGEVPGELEHADPAAGSADVMQADCGAMQVFHFGRVG